MTFLYCGSKFTCITFSFLLQVTKLKKQMQWGYDTVQLLGMQTFLMARVTYTVAVLHVCELGGCCSWFCITLQCFFLRIRSYLLIPQFEQKGMLRVTDLNNPKYLL